jgi:hypothetical protein
MEPNRMSLIRLLFIAFVLVFTNCRKTNESNGTTNFVSEHQNEVIQKWNDLILQIDRDAIGYRPGPGPRALSYIGLAAYEICVPGMPSFKSIANTWGSELAIPKLDQNKRIHWPSALNESYAFLLHNFYKNTVFVGGAGHLNNAEVHRKIDELHSNFASQYEILINPEEIKNSLEWGQSVSKLIWEWSVTDKYGHEAELNPLNNNPSKNNYYPWRKELLDGSGKAIPGIWSPTNDNGDGGMFPLWGKVRTFSITESQKLCKAPIPYSNSPKSTFYSEALQVYNTCNNSISYEEKWIAEFWSDDIVGLTFSPPLRMLAIFNQIIENESSNLEKAVEGVAKLGIALNDFGVACWHSKWHYKVERPENFIKREIDPQWEPLLVNKIDGVSGVTPAFPAYPSGHATFAGGSAIILENIFGANYEFLDNCHALRYEFNGKPRQFNSFISAGDENAKSRVFLGVHFRMDCDAGVELGRQIASSVLNQIQWKK